MKLPTAEVVKRRMLLTGELDELFLQHRRRLAELSRSGRIPIRIVLDPRSDPSWWTGHPGMQSQTNSHTDSRPVPYPPVAVSDRLMKS